MYVQRRGMAGACCDSCAHGGSCKSGLGLFEAGVNFTAWGWQEWLVFAMGGYMLTSVFFGTKRTARRARAEFGEFRKGRRVAKGGKLRAKAEKLRKRAEALEAA